MSETISEAIGADHRLFDVCADKIMDTSDEAEKVQWRNQLTWTIARHAIGEELTLYPAMEKHLGDEGVKLAKPNKEQHAGVKDRLYQLQDMPSVLPEFQPKLEELMDLLHHHIAHESDEDMPRLEKLLSREESQKLALSFQRTKNVVPTRSHPAAPTEYYAENLAALLAAPIDRLQDWLRDYPDEKDLLQAKDAIQ